MMLHRQYDKIDAYEKDWRLKHNINDRANPQHFVKIKVISSQKISRRFLKIFSQIMYFLDKRSKNKELLITESFLLAKKETERYIRIFQKSTPFLFFLITFQKNLY